jgi:hypothetical protein
VEWVSAEHVPGSIEQAETPTVYDVVAAVSPPIVQVRVGAETVQLLPPLLAVAT